MRKLGSISPTNGILLTLIFFLVTGGFAATQVALAESGSGVVTPSVSATETASNTPLPPSASTVQVKRSAHAEELHAARLAGDLAAVQALEASATIQPAVGENCGQPALRTSGAVCGPGDPRMTAASNRESAASSDGDRATFGADIKVRPSDLDTMEINPSMASDSDGNLYVAFQDDLSTTGYFYIQLYRSIDGGATWSAYGYVIASDTHLLTPSIAIGEGNEDKLLLAYIVDDGSGVLYPEVATTPLGLFDFTIQSVPHISTWEGYAKPVIWTDAYEYPGWYAYLTCEGVFEAAVDNINVCFWRSTDLGVTWNYPASGGPAVIGNMDAFAWLDADGTYGTTLGRVILACYNETDFTLYSLASDDFGNNWDETLDLKAISTLPYDPYYPVDPDIEAAIAYDHVMLVCTHDHDFDGQDDDDVGQTYSTDAGETWPNPLWNLDGTTDDHEFGADLNANEGGGSWHLTYTRWETPVNDHFVQYSQRPQDLGDYWQSFPDVVDDLALASIGYSKKGIASNWSTDVAGICWADYRDGTPDYDLYFDYDRGGASGPTVACSYSCSPSSGQLPFSTQMTVNMTNLYTGFTRTISGRINISTAGGGYISNWRAGFTNIPAGGTFTRSWSQNLPALTALTGTNYFFLSAMDTTASPYNQPPYPPAGDTDTAYCSIYGY